jgi:hypothetical protein
MSVYVDDYRAPFRGMKMSHLTADTDNELEAFARKLGLKPSWKRRNHYDVSESKRLEALKLGAIPNTPQESAKRVMAQRRGEAQ